MKRPKTCSTKLLTRIVTHFTTDYRPKSLTNLAISQKPSVYMRRKSLASYKMTPCMMQMIFTPILWLVEQTTLVWLIWSPTWPLRLVKTAHHTSQVSIKVCCSSSSKTSRLLSTVFSSHMREHSPMVLVKKTWLSIKCRSFTCWTVWQTCSIKSSTWTSQPSTCQPHRLTTTWLKPTCRPWRAHMTWMRSSSNQSLEILTGQSSPSVSRPSSSRTLF